MGDYAWPGIVSSLALLVYYFTLFKAGMARGRFKVPAPSHDGPEEYLRYVRAHQNTLEHLAIFLPSMWLFSSYVSVGWASVLGAVWIAARIWYGIEYAREGGKRGPGFGLSFAAVAILLVGAIIGIIAAMVRS